jgi:hypothetical protein
LCPYAPSWLPQTPWLSQKPDGAGSHALWGRRCARLPVSSDSARLSGFRFGDRDQRSAGRVVALSDPGHALFGHRGRTKLGEPLLEGDGLIEALALLEELNHRVGFVNSVMLICRRILLTPGWPNRHSVGYAKAGAGVRRRRGPVADRAISSVGGLIAVSRIPRLRPERGRSTPADAC